MAMESNGFHGQMFFMGDKKLGPSGMPAPTLWMDGGAVRRRGQAPALRGWNVSACPVVFRRVPAAGHTGPALRDHTNPLPAGPRGLWPSYRNNAKHGLSALPHFFQPTAPNHYKTTQNPQIKKFYSIFFKKSWGPGAKPRSPVATGETPAPRTARNPCPVICGQNRGTCRKRSGEWR